MYSISSSIWDSGSFSKGDDPALFHVGDYGHLMRMHEEHAFRANKNISGRIAAVGPFLMRRLADARTMMTACVDLLNHGPKSPGSDGMTLEMLDLSERWSLCRRLATEVRRGCYRPGPDRIVKVQKAGGKGFREITVQNARDRVVGRGLVRILQPAVDPQFSPFSFGGRPRKGPFEALACVKALAVSTSCWVWISDDIRSAFDRIPIAGLLQACRAHFPDDVIEFINVLASKGTRRGIRQGNPSSPLFANIFFDFFLDSRWHLQHYQTPVIRYIDDLLVVSKSIEDAKQLYVSLTNRSNGIGTPMKGDAESNILDLRLGVPINWLGYSISFANGRLAIHISDRAWRRLQLLLAEAYLSSAPPLRAEKAVHQWLNYLGPAYAFEDHGAVLAKIRLIANKFACEELSADVILMNTWRSSHRRWLIAEQRAADVLPQRLAQLRSAEAVLH